MPSLEPLGLRAALPAHGAMSPYRSALVDSHPRRSRPEVPDILGRHLHRFRQYRGQLNSAGGALAGTVLCLLGRWRGWVLPAADAWSPARVVSARHRPRWRPETAKNAKTHDIGELRDEH
jgi:hypothetical protein